MDITVMHKGESDIIKIIGRLDSTTSAKLESWASDFMHSPNNHIIMDFSQLDYISSAGLRVIFNMSKIIKNFPYKFSICHAQDHVREVFEISGFDSFIPLYESIDDCLL